MTATDELRAMLDERGVEYVANHRQTWWRFGTGGHAFAVNDGPTLCVALTGATAAQAIEATLGPREQPPYDELIEALRRDWDIEASWDGLRRFWYVGLTDEGVRKRDEREATLGRGECHIKDYEDTGYCVCSECGAVLPDDYTVYYCWNCGRKVVDE